MSNVEKWFYEALSTVNVHKDMRGVFLIYKGFKISKQEGEFRIQEVRSSEFYSSVNSKDYAILLKHGFLQGVDQINYFRNKILINDYKTKIKALYERKLNSQKKLPKNRKLNEKRIRVAEVKIDYYNDLILLLQSRNKYLKIKYSL